MYPEDDRTLEGVGALKAVGIGAFLGIWITLILGLMLLGGCVKTSYTPPPPIQREEPPPHMSDPIPPGVVVDDDTIIIPDNGTIVIDPTTGDFTVRDEHGRIIKTGNVNK